MLKTKRFKAQFYGYGLLILSTPQTSLSKDLQQPPAVSTESAVVKNAAVKDSLLLPQQKQDTLVFAAPKIQLHPRAEHLLPVYLKKNTEDLTLIKKRSAAPFKIIETIFRKNNLPLELKYLAVIESKLKSGAVSRVGAVGPWQFMPQTAKYLGLKVGNYDERKHYTKSSQAAAKYLKILYTQFDDWLLVIAAYNSGAGPVYKAIKKSGSRDFWKLQKYLPAETRAHVKHYIGAHYFFENRGSETTLTKTERQRYLTALADYTANMNTVSEANIMAPVMESVERTSMIEARIKEDK